MPAHRIFMAAAGFAAIFSAAAVCTDVCRAQAGPDHLRAGILLCNGGKFRDAIRELEEAGSITPGDPRVSQGLAVAHHGLAREQADRSEWQTAVENERIALKHDVTNSYIKAALSAYCGRRGIELVGQDRLDEAKAMFQEACLLGPSDKTLIPAFSAALLRKAESFLKQSRADDAIRMLNAAVGIDPKNRYVYIWLGHAHYEKDGFDLAVRNWEKALALDPDAKDAGELKDKISRTKKETGVEKDFDRKEREHFVVKYEGEKREDMAWKIIGFLEEAYRDVGRIFAYWPANSVTVTIYTGEQFRQVTGKPDWIVGLYDGRIKVKAGDLAASDETLRRILRHEYTHAAVFGAFGAGVPIWLHEGLAEAAAVDRPPTEEERMKLIGALGGKVIGPWQVEWQFNSTNAVQVEAAYLCSRLFVKYMFDRYGLDVAGKFVAGVARGRSIDDVARELFNRSKEDLVADWALEMGQRGLK